MVLWRCLHYLAIEGEEGRSGDSESAPRGDKRQLDDERATRLSTQ